MSVTAFLVPSPVPPEIADDDAPVGRPRDLPGYHRVRRGVYAPQHEWDRLAARERYLTRVHALAAIRPNTVFCMESAAALLGLPLFGEPRRIHAFAPGLRRSTSFGDVTVHTSATARRVDAGGTIAVVDAADTSIDLAHVLPPAFGLAVMDAAIAAHPAASTMRDELQHRLETRAPAHGRRRAEWALGFAVANSESVGESVSRAVISWLGLEAPELQCVFRSEGARDRTDFLWRRASVAGEFDGWDKYPTHDPRAARAAFIAEKRREDRLRRQLRAVVRWEWRDALHPHHLERLLAQAGVPRTDRRRPSLLADVGRNPRST